MSNNGVVIIVQGAQWGSEAKGVMTAHLCVERQAHYCVRTGAINAGHTIWYKGREYKMQQLPVGWVNPGTDLVIGPGAYIHPETLEREAKWISKATGEDARLRIFIDHRAGLHKDAHTVISQNAGRHHLIGATAKGCSSAIVDKIESRGRRGEELLFRNHAVAQQYNLVDTQEMLMFAYEGGSTIVIEGTQGTWLDFHLGPYPYTTSRMTSAANWVAEAGLPPTLDFEVVLVTRTYPIRVAGNSGPMLYEISWPILARAINRKTGDEPFVMPSSIEKFEEYLAASRHSASMPRYEDERWNALNQHEWPANIRYEYQTTLSELNATALRGMSSGHPEEYRDLMGLFEMTTVTKKLRRIAEFDAIAVRKAARFNGASYIALTFLNYEFPKIWGDPDGTRACLQGPQEGAINSYLSEAEEVVECPIKYVTVGPLQEHVVKRS